MAPADVPDRIELIDEQILSLLNERAECALRASRRGEPTRGLDQVVEEVRSRAPRLVRPDFSERLFRAILSESDALQGQALKLIGFQGEHGAYGELAARMYGHGHVPIPVLEFGHVFDAVRDGELDLGVVPVENSIEGIVNEVNDHLVDTELKVIGEIYVPVHHCLLALPGTDPEELKVAYSHPQALGQCRGYLSRHHLEARPFYDTAGAAKWLANKRSRAAGVIASSLCADLYHLDILDESIEDHTSNVTRFLVLSARPGPADGTKCSIVFSTRHRAGALLRVLGAIANAGINLTRIESRPIRTEPGYYAFFADFLGSIEDPRVKLALEEAGRDTSFLRVLGCYPEATTP